MSALWWTAARIGPISSRRVSSKYSNLNVVIHITYPDFWIAGWLWASRRCWSHFEVKHLHGHPNRRQLQCPQGVSLAAQATDSDGSDCKRLFVIHLRAHCRQLMIRLWHSAQLQTFRQIKMLGTVSDRFPNSYQYMLAISCIHSTARPLHDLGM